MPLYVAAQLKAVERLFPKLQAPSLPVWLVVHREIKGNPLIRAVYDGLAKLVPLHGRATGGARAELRE
jgi:hypothetical protein